MNPSVSCHDILSQLNQYHRITATDDDTVVRKAMRDILDLWPRLLALDAQVSEDDLFALNVSRAAITQVFTVVIGKDSFDKDPPFIRELFFSCFNILTDHPDVFRQPPSAFLDSNIRLMMRMISSITSLVPFTANDFSNKKDKELFLAFREHIDADVKHDNLTDGIISLVWNISDRTVLVPFLLEMGYGSSVVDWIKQRDKKFRREKLDAPLHIVHNLARHDDGIDLLNRHHARDIIDGIAIRSNDDDDDSDLAIHLAMIRVLLMDYQQIESKSSICSQKIVDLLFNLASKAAVGDRHRHAGSHVSEPLIVLVKLCHNPSYLEYLLNHSQSMVDFTASLVIEFYPHLKSDENVLENFTCVIIFNFLDVISSHKKYHALIKQNTPLFDLIKSAVNKSTPYVDTFMPRTMKSISQAAKNIVANLADWSMCIEVMQENALSLCRGQFISQGCLSFEE